MIELLRDAEEVRAWRAVRRRAAETVALVPTMGALHEGHLALIDTARRASDAVLVSIFVNPTQFGPHEDFESYPRDLDGDVATARERGADAVFAPSEEVMYPEEQTIWVDPGPLAHRLCGLSRPGHFRGVLTVVAKLWALSEPDVSVFGRKDFQQSVLVRRMARQFGFPGHIETVATVREEDGLALSSRNAYLSPADRRTALGLARGLREARARFAQGESRPEALEAAAGETMEVEGVAVEYAEVVEPEGLEKPDRAAREHVLAVAARVGGTRLIDNETLGGSSPLDALGAAEEAGAAAEGDEADR